MKFSPVTSFAVLTLLSLGLDPALAQGDDDAEEDILVRWKNDAGMRAVNRVARRRNCNARARRRIGCIRATRREIRRLRNNPDIEFVEYDQPFSIPDGEETTDTPGRALRRLQFSNFYGYEMVQANQLGDHSTAAANVDVRVCVIDTGYNLGHTYLPNDSAESCADGAATEDYPNWFTDLQGHGTHVSGTIAMLQNGAVSGVNPSCNKFEIFTCQGLGDNGSGSTASVIDAAENCCIGDLSDDHVTKKVVINMSLGGSGYSQAMDTVMSELYEDNILLVAASGNDGANTVNYPSYHSSVMSVGAVDFDELVTDFSSTNDQVEISGPGRWIYSTTNDGGYGYKSGTSMATPHVAGVAALVWRYYPECTNKQIRQALIHSAKTLAPNDADQCDENSGHGIVQAKAAFDLIASVGCSAFSNDSPVGGCNHKLPLTDPTPEPTPGPTPEPTPGPTPEPTPGPTPEPTPGPTPEPTPGPTPEPTPGPTPEPTPGPTDGPTPEPTPGPTPEPTPGPTPEPTDEPGSAPETCNNNRICELTETCSSCPNDCEHYFGGVSCGNGVCEAGNGEDYRNCPSDCARFCGAGAPFGCRPNRCQRGRRRCVMDPRPTEESYSCCGDGVCGFREGRPNCFVDCCTKTGDSCRRDRECCSLSCVGRVCA